MVPMKLEFSKHTELRLLTHVIDIPVLNGKSLRLFQDFSCKWTDEPLVFQPYAIITK